MEGCNIYYDDELELGKWRWDTDVKTGKFLLFVAYDIFSEISTGLIREELQKEITKKTSNGGSIT